MSEYRLWVLIVECAVSVCKQNNWLMHCYASHLVIYWSWLMLVIYIGLYRSGIGSEGITCLWYWCYDAYTRVIVLYRMVLGSKGWNVWAWYNEGNPSGHKLPGRNDMWGSDTRIECRESHWSHLSDVSCPGRTKISFGHDVKIMW